VEQSSIKKKRLTAVRIHRINGGWFLRQIFRILECPVELTSLVGQVVVKTLTSWFYVTCTVAGGKAICLECLVDVIKEGEPIM